MQGEMNDDTPETVPARTFESRGRHGQLRAPVVFFFIAFSALIAFLASRAGFVPLLFLLPLALIIQRQGSLTRYPVVRMDESGLYIAGLGRIVWPYIRGARALETEAVRVIDLDLDVPVQEILPGIGYRPRSSRWWRTLNTRTVRIYAHQLEDDLPLLQAAFEYYLQSPVPLERVINAD